MEGVIRPYFRLSPTIDTRACKYEVSLCLVFYNEAKFLKEWLDYHLVIGVSHFYLYNNNSTDDYMPVSVLEGMNAGLLVISSNVGGVPYMIEDGVNGLLFESKNAEALAEKMILAVEKQEMVKSMINKGNQSLGKYTWASVREQLLPLYEN